MKKIALWLLTIVCTAFTLSCFSGCLSTCRKVGKVAGRYEINAEYVPENRAIAGTVKVTFENLTDEEIDGLKFQLYPNAYRKDALYAPVSSAYASAAYYAGDS